MDAQPNPTEVKATPPKIKYPHSVVGIISTICGAFAMAAAIFFISILNSDLQGSGLDIFGMLGIVPMFICSSLALILGIIGLTLKNRRKLFAIIGIGVPILFALIVATYYFYILNVTRFDRGKLPLRDDFTHEHWQTSDHDTASVQYYQDTLQFMVEKNDFESSAPSEITYKVGSTYKNIHIEVTAVTENTDPQTFFGIMCGLRYSYKEYRYFLGITPVGRYAIGKYIPNEKTIILTNNGDWASSSQIVQNASSYRVGADCGNGNLTLYVDGKKIDSVYDSDITEGLFALLVWNLSDTSKTVVGFDDFLMKKK